MSNLLRSAISTFFLVFALQGCANIDSWSRTDKVLASMAMTAGAVDARSTIRLLDHPGFKEDNIFLGEHPSDTHVVGYFAATHLTILYLADRFPRIRKPLLFITTVAGGSAAAHNRNLYH